LKNISDNSVDLLLTDPPYGTNDQYGKSIKRGKEITSFNTIDWDFELPLDYFKESYRILKDDRWGVIFTDKKEITTIWNKLSEFGFSPRNTFYWIKTNKAPTPKSNFKSSVETCIVFTKGRTNKKWRGGGNQNNYFMCPFVSGSEKVKHPTQKPVKLIEHLIRLFTDEGDMIIDPYMGSGTTGVAAINSQREFIGIEIDSEYFDMAKQRIHRQQQLIKNKTFREEKIKKFF